MNKHSHVSEADAATSTALPSAPLVPRGDPVWQAVRDDALAAIDRDEATAPLFHALVLDHPSLEDALIAVLSRRLGDSLWPHETLAATLQSCLATDPSTLDHLGADMQAVLDRDPACNRMLEPLVYFKGFQALQTHRFAHTLWQSGRKDMALFLQSRTSAIFQVDIHPATSIRGGIFLDHATGIVIGETAVIDENVSIMQNVTLGGTGKTSGDRHPKVRCGVLVGAGAKVLGNIELGKGSRVAASSVVLDDVPDLATVAGIPAKIVSMAEAMGPDCMPAVNMDHTVLQERQVHVDMGSGI